MVYKFDIFIKLLTQKIQGIHNGHLGEKWNGIKADDSVLQVDPESVQ